MLIAKAKIQEYAQGLGSKDFKRGRDCRDLNDNVLLRMVSPWPNVGGRDVCKTAKDIYEAYVHGWVKESFDADPERIKFLALNIK